MHKPRLNCEIHEGGSGPHVFMVHGMLSSRLQWLPNLAAITEVARPVVFELWGHGRSPAPEDPKWYDVDAVIDQFEAAREELGADRILLCGQSLGAALTLRYAIRHPERVIAQVFTNSISALSPPERFRMSDERLAMIEELEKDGRAALSRLPIHPARARRLSPEVRDLLVREADQADPAGIARIMRFTAPNLSVAADLARTRCPTLLVNGLWEKGFQDLRGQAERLIPGCRVADLQAGHAVNLEAPEAFNQAVTGFLRSALS